MDPTRTTSGSDAPWAFPAMVWPQVVESVYRREQLVTLAAVRRVRPTPGDAGVIRAALSQLVRRRPARHRQLPPVARTLPAGR